MAQLIDPIEIYEGEEWKGFTEGDAKDERTLGYHTIEADLNDCLKVQFNKNMYNIIDYFPAEESVDGKMETYIFAEGGNFLRKYYYGMPKYATEMPAWKDHDFVTLGDVKEYSFNYDRLKQRKPFTAINTAQISRIHVFPQELKDMFNAYELPQVKNPNTFFRGNKRIELVELINTARKWVDDKYNKNNKYKTQLIEADMDTVKYFKERYGNDISKYLFALEKDYLFHFSEMTESADEIYEKEDSRRYERYGYKFKTKIYSYFYLVTCYSVVTDLETAEPKNLAYIRNKIGSKYPDFYTNADFYSDVNGSFYDWTQNDGAGRIGFKTKMEGRKRYMENTHALLRNKTPENIKALFDSNSHIENCVKNIEDEGYGFAPVTTNVNSLSSCYLGEYVLPADKLYRKFSYKLSKCRVNFRDFEECNAGTRKTVRNTSTFMGITKVNEYTYDKVFDDSPYRKACTEEFAKDKSLFTIKPVSYIKTPMFLENDKAPLKILRCCFWRFTYRSPFYSLLEDEEMYEFCLNNYISGIDKDEIVNSGDDLVFMHQIKPWIWRPCGAKNVSTFDVSIRKNITEMSAMSMYNNYNEMFWGEHITQNLYNEWIYCLNLVRLNLWDYNDSLAVCNNYKVVIDEKTHAYDTNKNEAISLKFAEHKCGMRQKDALMNILCFMNNKRFYYELTVDEIENMDLDKIYDWKHTKIMLPDGTESWNYPEHIDMIKYIVTYNEDTKEILSENLPIICTEVY